MDIRSSRFVWFVCDFVAHEISVNFLKWLKNNIYLSGFLHDMEWKNGNGIDIMMKRNLENLVEYQLKMHGIKKSNMITGSYPS